MVGRLAFFLAAFLICCGAPILWPGIDLATSHLFWRPDGGFFLADWPLFRAVHVGTRGVVALIAAGTAIALFWALWRRRLPAATAAAFLLIALALGPGLLVNGVFKDHWGRARPAQVTQFGGDKAFTRAFVPADQCRHNCSFTAGDPAVGFYCVSFALLLPAGYRRRVGIAAALALGLFLGLVRMAQGGHFLSDVLASGFLMVALSWALWRAIVIDHALPRLYRRVRAPPPALRRYLIIAAATIVVGMLSYLLIDRPLAELCHDAPSWLTALFGQITKLGQSTGWLILAAGVAVACWWRARHHARAALFVFAAVALSGVIADLVKPVFGRLRPKLLFADHLYGFTWQGAHADHWSFPSGHTVTAAALATALSLAFPRGWPLYLVVALLIAASRIILDAHYLSDVLAGALLGAGVALALWPAMRPVSDSP